MSEAKTRGPLTTIELLAVITVIGISFSLCSSAVRPQIWPSTWPRVTAYYLVGTFAFCVASRAIEGKVILASALWSMASAGVVYWGIMSWIDFSPYKMNMVDSPAMMGMFLPWPMIPYLSARVWAWRSGSPRCTADMICASYLLHLAVGIVTIVEFGGNGT